jgi:hypothetical protein
MAMGLMLPMLPKGPIMWSLLYWKLNNIIICRCMKGHWGHIVWTGSISRRKLFIS